MIDRITIARHDQWYYAWPDVARVGHNGLICVFSECTHHRDRTHTRVMLVDSSDRGRH